MKRNIEAVTVDRNLVARLAKTLKYDTEQTGIELSRALAELLEGECSSLLLELDGTANDHDDGCIRCEGITIYTSARKVIEDGKDISLTPKEYDILCLLARNRGQVFTKEQIYKTVWDNDFYMDSSNIMSFIRKIRKKIEKNPDDPKYVQTVWGIGYRFGDPE